MFDTLSNLPTHEAATRALAVLLDSGAKGVALLALAAGGSFALRRASAASRHLVWTLAMAGLLLLPALSVVVPKWQLPLLPPTLGIRSTPSPLRTTPETPWTKNRVPGPSSAAPATSTPRSPEFEPETASRMLPPEVETAPASAPPSAPSASPTPPRLPAAFWALAVWLGVAGAILLPLLAGLAAVARLVRAARPFADKAWSDRLRDLSAALGVERPVRLLCAGPGAMPMAVGLFRPAILLPQEADTWPEEKRRAVLLHELAHVARRDCLTHALARVALALHWFNPLAWVALRQMRVERERACDDRVLTAGERASTYADHLLDIARTMHAGTLASVAAITMAKQSQLEGRLVAVLDPKRNRRLVTRRNLICGAVLLLTITCSLAALQTGRSTEGDVNKAIGILSRTSMFQKDASEKIQTVLTLVKHHPQAETLPLLVDWLSSYRKTKRRSALYIIGELSWENPAIALKPLRKLMGHSEDITRGMAALTLSYLQDQASGERILKMLQSDTSPYARRCAAFALGELNDPNARETLEKAALAEENQVRENAQNAVARLKWRKEFESVTGDPAKAARGVWIIAGSTENQAERIGRAMELIRATDPVSRAAVLRKAQMFDAPDLFFFKGAYVLATQQLKERTDSQGVPPNYSLKLEENLSIQLLGVTEHKWSEYTPWWYPDGTRGAILPDNLKNPSGNPSLDDLNKPTPDEQNYAFAFLINQENNRQVDWCFELTAGKTVLNSQSDYRQVQTNYTWGNEPIGVIEVRLPAGATTCSLRLGVAGGAWETVAVYENEKKELVSSSEPSFQIKAVKADNEGLVVEYEHSIKDRPGQIVAIRKDGQSLTANRSGVGLNNSPFPFVCFAAKPEEIARFEFQTRPGEWVNFHNISLVPDLKTHLHMTLENGAAAIGTNAAAPANTIQPKTDSLTSAPAASPAGSASPTEATQPPQLRMISTWTSEEQTSESLREDAIRPEEAKLVYLGWLTDHVQYFVNVDEGLKLVWTPEGKIVPFPDIPENDFFHLNLNSGVSNSTEYFSRYRSLVAMLQIPGKPGKAGTPEKQREMDELTGGLEATLSSLEGPFQVKLSRFRTRFEEQTSSWKVVFIFENIEKTAPLPRQVKIDWSVDKTEESQTDAEGMSLRISRKASFVTETFPLIDPDESSAPQLRMISTWTSEKQPPDSLVAWKPDGKPVDDRYEREVLDRYPHTVDSAEPTTHPVALGFWVHHPLFDNRSRFDLVLYDARHQNIASPGGSRINDPETHKRFPGWRSEKKIFDSNTLPDRGQVELRYSLGPWTHFPTIFLMNQTGAIPDEPVVVHSYQSRPNEMVEVSFSVLLPGTEAVDQYEAVALIGFGEHLSELESESATYSREGETGRYTLRFRADQSIIKGFRVRHRPIQRRLYDNVVFRRTAESTPSEATGETTMGNQGIFFEETAFSPDYINQVVAALNKNFILPPYIREAKTCTVRFKILQNGSLVEPQVIAGQGTGIPGLDQLALNAVLQAGPVPPYAPEYSTKPFVYSRVTFQFTPAEENSRKTLEETKSDIGIEEGNFPAEYLAQVVPVLNKEFVLPPNIREKSSCTVRFKIFQDGQLVEPQVIAGQGTGIPGLDQLALNAVLQAGPVPPYPPEYSTKPFVYARVNFAFTPSVQ